ncbi:class I SAM-dependent methyltransferase [Microcoleus sp. PH2017_28_MFU_U_A]|uniref:class I SAM-dependent methyltransferase n=1 Tax=Microcoleus sp. PH2017_28_MFU_U_A TaxID=2798838 RepID=UPI001DC16DF0|nr:class I SAM-dependent methyltransferase [Microcoleus sp. PH2017_28_MFU_U_A]MCC3589218.1 class I SAM-dependent methyltransferase [Microcoleus sp. PH2017_28_MFU_U_A]
MQNNSSYERYNRYIEGASLYDFDNRSKVQDDIPFYVELARETTGLILELGCGTGRITIPILKTGKTIYGLDDSLPMLDVLEEKISSLEKVFKDRLFIIKSQMSSFSIDKKFELIILPYSTFQGLCNIKEISGCFQSVRKHLTLGGSFVFSCFKPSEFLTQTWVTKKERTDFIIYNDDGTKKIERKSINRKINTKSQIIYSDLFYYEYEDERIKRMVSDKLRMKYYYPDQIEDIIATYGFYIVAKYGYFDKRSYDDESATQMIFNISPKK